MTQKMPNKELDIIGPLGLNPDKCIREFMRCKEDKKLYMRPPWNEMPIDIIDSLATANLREKRNMIQLQKIQLEDADTQQSINTTRLKLLNNMFKGLKQQFIEVNHFVKDCDDKKQAANKKVNQEKVFHVDLKNAIKSNSEGIETLSEFRTKLEETYHMYEPYEKVLNDVVAEASDWREVRDCMTSVDALMQAQVEITRMKSLKLVEIEDLRQKFNKTVDDAAITIVAFQNELAQLDRMYYRAVAATQKFEKVLVKTKSCISKSQLMYSRMSDEIVTDYKILCNRRGIDPNLNWSIEEMLNFIRHEIRTIKEVIALCSSDETYTTN